MLLLALRAHPWTHQVPCQSLGFPFCKIGIVTIVLPSCPYIYTEHTLVEGNEVGAGEGEFRPHMRLYQIGKVPAVRSTRS